MNFNVRQNSRVIWWWKSYHPQYTYPVSALTANKIGSPKARLEGTKKLYIYRCNSCPNDIRGQSKTDCVVQNKTNNSESIIDSEQQNVHVFISDETC